MAQADWSEKRRIRDRVEFQGESYKKARKKVAETPFGTCQSCDTPLGVAGGYADTELCGPCCCGEAELFAEFGETW